MEKDEEKVLEAACEVWAEGSTDEGVKKEAACMVAGMMTALAIIRGDNVKTGCKDLVDKVKNRYYTIQQIKEECDNKIAAAEAETEKYKNLNAKLLRICKEKGIEIDTNGGISK